MNTRKLAADRLNLKWNGLALVAILCVLTVANSPAQQNVATTATGSMIEVKIDNFAFSPAIVTVRAGTHVTWINKDDIPHTVDSTQGKFKSAALDTDEKFDFIFSAPGEYPFYCRMHPKMTGKIIVRP